PRAENLDRLLHARRSGSPETVHISAADEHGARANAQRLHDIASSSNPAVQEHFPLIPHRRNYLRQDAQRRRNAVELTAAVIANAARRRAAVDRPAGIVRGVHALDDDRPGPRLADPFEVGPRHHGLFERGADIGVWHWLAVQDDVRKAHETAV